MELPMQLWAYREDVGGAGEDLVGYRVEAADGHFGRVTEAIHDAGRDYLVVHTGRWVFGRQVAIPAGVVWRIDPSTQEVMISLTKDQVKGSPEFHPERFDANVEQLDAYYRRSTA